MINSHSQKILLTPGPVPLSAHVLKMLSEPMIHHRSQEFVELFLQLQQQLKKFFQTEQPVLVLNGSGTAAMSAALLNTLSPQDTVLAVCAGRFGERWAEIAAAYHLNVIRLQVPWGHAVAVKEIDAALKKHSPVKAVLVQACETSTGVIHPIQQIAKLLQQTQETLCIVDAISALGAIHLPMDQWGIDIMLGGSQKSFELPTGMSFIALSQKAWLQRKQSQLPVYYLDLQR